MNNTRWLLSKNRTEQHSLIQSSEARQATRMDMIMEPSWKSSLEWGWGEGIPGETAPKTEVGKFEVRVERITAWLRKECWGNKVEMVMMMRWAMESQCQAWEFSPDPDPPSLPSVVVHSVVSDSLRPHGLQHVRLARPSPSLGVCSNSCSLSWWCHPTISSSSHPFLLLLSIFPILLKYFKFLRLDYFLLCILVTCQVVVCGQYSLVDKSEAQE